MIYEDEEALEDTGLDAHSATPESRSGTVVMAVLAGAAIGAAMALLLAPRSGRETRRVLRKRADGLRETAGTVIDDTTEDLTRELRRRGRQIRRKLDRMA
jgi:gas vesicle protein